jgi:RHS repeat-associated protein
MRDRPLSEYGPFGEQLVVTGLSATSNPIRFSSRFHEDESGSTMYPLRAYVDGRFLSRDPAEEFGGDNPYEFVNNASTMAIDPLGLWIQTCEPIDNYLKSLGITYTVAGKYLYGFVGIDTSTTANPKMIVTRMLISTTVFNISSSGGSVKNLQAHVAARLTIVKNALSANFLFVTSMKQNWTGFNIDPQAYFDQLNNGKTKIACQALSEIIFQTGNKFGQTEWARGTRKNDHIWIPGDWGWIRNRAYVDNGTENGLEGENVFHTGTSAMGEMFWGHFTNGVHGAESENEWFDDIRHRWYVPGDPVWKETITYPVVGLQK